MHTSELISKKRDGLALSVAEINWLIKAYTQGEIPDYQMAAWLMAVFFRGMTDEETAALTMAMAHSGNTVDLRQVPGIKVDKHSTGGVADTTTLVLAPLVAAAGVPVAKMSGRGLGFTGGTIDKLESIPGFKTTLNQQDFIDNLIKYNIAVTGQSADIAPADGKLYALRDVTATVESIPLIASSIMSKKIAAGADKIVLDVKVGNGAFMKNKTDAINLAESMVRIGQLVGRETVAILTSMEEPLGMAIGNSLEIREAIELLSGRGEQALKTVCLTLGAQMLLLAGKAETPLTGRKLLEHLLDSRQALHKFSEFITGQQGDPTVIDNMTKLPSARFVRQVTVSVPGYVGAINASQVGYAAMRLGAGREYKGQIIDLAAGIVMHCRIGQKLVHQQPIATLYTNDESRLQHAAELLQQAVMILDNPVEAPPLLLGLVNKHGFQDRLE